MINILFIHQSAELYGSDKTLLTLVKNLDKVRYNPIVVLPSEGLLTEEFLKENIQYYIIPVFKLHRKMFNPLNIINVLQQTNKSFKSLERLHEKFKFDLVYSNTLAVLIGILFAKKKKIKHIWHVHEIIKSPKIVATTFRKLISLSSNTKIVYNSKATQDFWSTSEKIKAKSVTILNGIKLDSTLTDLKIDLSLKKTLFNSDKELIIGLVGRISNWKGHYVLLESFKELNKTNKNLKLVFIGSPPPNQNYLLDNLMIKINEYNLENYVVIIPFYEKIYKIWNCIDIAVVPSLEPEPFGLVAVEAMLAKKPVIGSNHGGLTEIIIDSETGFLVEPNNDVALKEALQYLIDNPDKRVEFGNNGYRRAIDEFSELKYIKKFQNLFTEMIAK